MTPPMRIPLAAPDICESDIAAVTSVLRTPQLSLGPRLEEFERVLAEYVGVSSAVAVSSGTSALHLCIRALNIGEGDEVILPSFAFVAVANGPRYERATPVFVDVDPETLNLDPAAIEAAITPKTRAILVVHTFGCPADLGEILRIARKHSLFVIEDACEAIGAEFDGNKVGSLGDVGVFGFYPNKQITTGEGGAIATRNPVIAALVRSLRNQGRGDPNDWLEHTHLGYNYRISEMQCALGIEQFKRIEPILRRREAIARGYHERLSGNPSLILPPLSLPRRTMSWSIYVVRLAARFPQEQRDWIRDQMVARGIGCGRYFAPVHLQPIYQSDLFRRHDLSVTESNAQRTLALPFFNCITEAQMDEVCQLLQELVRTSASSPSTEVGANPDLS
jgi:perosamine synthetase